MKKWLISIFCVFLVFDTINAFLIGETIGLSSATTYSGRMITFNMAPIEYSVVMVLRLVAIIGCVGTVLMKEGDS
ncbi:hypothetical protein [Colwellia sp. RSH04]|uniref:hypothetical protein n=1 Tax=Colwellia sp. RSH04 TaxID=2305464 RepID=UPI000E5707F0|nr:hypothetical protein [Colwellia sp. RSH04]RHW74605.1 hypothetical protein D1094_18050 [Colwellia sp. RSH04]